MLDERSRVREPYRRMQEVLAGMSPEELKARADALVRGFLEQGVTFDLGGEERPFPLDLVPRVIADTEWSFIERGVAQRVRALEAFLADVYGERRAVADGVVPLSAITSSAHFHRQVKGVEPANGVRITVAGIDLIRAQDSRFMVLEDNVRVPSGVSYVLANRRAVSQLLPQVFAQMGVRPVGTYPAWLRGALRAAAPWTSEPTVVVLSPGVYNSAYFEHSLLARSMGVELVEGRDLRCYEDRVYVRTTDGEQRVDVVYRRVDDEFIDPVQFRSDSMLGCTGLLNAARAGNVAICNAVGNGVADDKLIYTYVPDLIRYYLAEEPVLPNVDTWRLEDEGALEEVLDRLDELVVKPVDGSGGKGVLLGPMATRAELDQARARLAADPRGWIAQPMVMLSTVPTVIDGELAPRHVDLRPFVVNDGEEIKVLAGGLTRVALPEGEMIVNSSRGGGSKDTWVLRPPGRRPTRRAQQMADAAQEMSSGGMSQTLGGMTQTAPGRAEAQDVGPAAAGPDPGPARLVSQQEQQQQEGPC